MTGSSNIKDTIKWLLEGDACIRYQVHRDLLHSPLRTIRAEQAAMQKSGWGKALLDRQDADHMWGGGLYTPKWTSTFYTLQTLKVMGMRPAPGINKAIRLILDKGYFKDGGINLWGLKQSEPCVTGMFLSVACHFTPRDERINGLADHLLMFQMPDGGWNCRQRLGAKHSSFHTTISALEGLWEYEKVTGSGRKAEICSAREKAIEFLLQHRLYRSHRTGRISDPRMTRFSFPHYWRYDVMRALDHLQACNYEYKDERLHDAIGLLRDREDGDGRWKLQQKHNGRVYFDMEPQGLPSRWNTLRALRILRWWEE